MKSKGKDSREEDRIIEGKFKSNVRKIRKR